MAVVRRGQEEVATVVFEEGQEVTG